jgi:hypothetical protein
MAGTIGAEAVMLLGFTYLSAPQPIAIQSGSVAWLQAHLGGYRFLTLGPIQPNYGSYFGIAEANVNDLPFPKAWSEYIQNQLDNNAPPLTFNGSSRLNSNGPTAAQELTAHLASYESVGIRYVVENANSLDLQGTAYPMPGAPSWPAGPRLVYRDSFAEIWQLPAATPFYSLRPDSSSSAGSRAATSIPSSCTVKASGWDQVSVHCPVPTTLVRRVQFMPGWKANFAGHSVDVGEDQAGPAGLFQAVRLPAGTTAVRFTYLPPHELLAGIVALLAALAVLGGLITRRSRSEGSSSPHESADL